ncbi:hypothetical protein [Azospirillum canadense]|uniref:hypothetical protein n=1 Tax=Azospirillum canadense TaxID=403962 RepID=UPI0022265019|nr:hypothetical protein [Azospirillum canadense]MCW2242311.1 hypothetical protein [Azospirillum canadense]
MSGFARRPKPPPLIDKSGLPIQPFTGRANKPDAWFRSKEHGAWIRTMPCMVCGRASHVAGAHVRKGTDGAGEEQPSDVYMNPLCDGWLDNWSFYGCHNRQHKIGEVTFWTPHGGVEQAVHHALGLALKSPCERTRKAAAAIKDGKPWRDAFT